MKTITKNILNSLVSKYGVNPKYPDTFILSEKQVSCILSDFTPRQNANAYGKYQTFYDLFNYSGYDFTMYSKGKYTFCSLRPVEFTVRVTEHDDTMEDYTFFLRFRHEREFKKWLKDNEEDIISVNEYDVIIKA